MSARTTLTRRFTIAFAAVALVVLAGACGSSAGAKATATTSPPSPTTTRKENPYYDSGSTVTITSTAYQPKVLIAEVNVPLTFVNHTTVVQRVQFDHSRDASGQIRHSGAIAPGASWTFTPTNWESATYHSGTEPVLRGQIQIQPPVNP
jgi:hypothetical protein